MEEYEDRRRYDSGAAFEARREDNRGRSGRHGWPEDRREEARWREEAARREDLARREEVRREEARREDAVRREEVARREEVRREEARREVEGRREEPAVRGWEEEVEERRGGVGGGLREGLDGRNRSPPPQLPPPPPERKPVYERLGEKPGKALLAICRCSTQPRHVCVALVAVQLCHATYVSLFHSAASRMCSSCRCSTLPCNVCVALVAVPLGHVTSVCLVSIKTSSLSRRFCLCRPPHCPVSSDCEVWRAQ